MEKAHTYESAHVEVIGIHLASSAAPKVEGVEFAAERVFLEDDERLYFVTLTSIPVDSSGPALKTPQNPCGILETVGGGLQRLANLEAAIPGVIDKEPSAFMRELATSNVSSLNMASIESGVLPTYANYDSVIIITVPGKLNTAAICSQSGEFTFPDKPQVSVFNPQDLRDPRTWQHRSATLDETPFSQTDMKISVNDEQATFPDRAISVVYDSKTDMTYIGISRGVEFDRQDVKKTVDDRMAHPNDPAYDRRVADNMLARLQSSGLIDAEGYYERVEAGTLVRRRFDVQNPHEYFNPSFSRARQIAEMEVVLFNAVKTVRRQGLRAA
jgi:hypothetical protein